MVNSSRSLLVLHIGSDVWNAHFLNVHYQLKVHLQFSSHVIEAKK